MSVRSGQGESVAADLVIEGLAVDAEASGGPADIVLLFLKDFMDMFFFNLRQGEGSAGVFFACPLVEELDMRGKTLQGEFGALLDDGGPFDHVFQLPDIAGPGVALKQFADGFSDLADGIVAAPFVMLLDEVIHQKLDIFKPFA